MVWLLACLSHASYICKMLLYIGVRGTVHGQICLFSYIPSGIQTHYNVHVLLAQLIFVSLRSHRKKGFKNYLNGREHPDEIIGL